MQFFIPGLRYLLFLYSNFFLSFTLFVVEQPARHQIFRRFKNPPKIRSRLNLPGPVPKIAKSMTI